MVDTLATGNNHLHKQDMDNQATVSNHLYNRVTGNLVMDNNLMGNLAMDSSQEDIKLPVMDNSKCMVSSNSSTACRVLVQHLWVYPKMWHPV